MTIYNQAILAEKHPAVRREMSYMLSAISSWKQYAECRKLVRGPAIKAAWALRIRDFSNVDVDAILADIGE